MCLVLEFHHRSAAISAVVSQSTMSDQSKASEGFASLDPWVTVISMRHFRGSGSSSGELAVSTAHKAAFEGGVHPENGIKPGPNASPNPHPLPHFVFC